MTAKPKTPVTKPVSVEAKVRKAFPWFELLLQKAKEAAIAKRRKDERARGVQLTQKELERFSDALEEIQRQLNPLLTEREKIVTKLLAHWGHTGLDEIEGTLGKTLISQSFTIALDPDVVKEKGGDVLWQKVTERVLQPLPFLREGDKSVDVRNILPAVVKIKMLVVSVTSPSSRRAKSGAADDEEAEAEAA